MNVNGKTVVITGAAGGIGSAMATDLAGAGATLVLVDIDADRIETLNTQLGGTHHCIATDLATADGAERVFNECVKLPDPVDMLVNSAGLADFGMLSDQSPEQITRLLSINLSAPILLSQLFLSLLGSRPEAAIINMGSTFGSIGHPAYSTYCASKFGLRGFSEALRRELADTNVHVLYIAPRATRTGINSDAVVTMNRALGNAMDEPRVVSKRLLHMLRQTKPRDHYIGWPEKLFVRINNVLPRLVDNALKKQLPVIQKYARH